MANFRYALCLVGLLLAIPILVLIALAFALPITGSGRLYLLAASLVSAGLISAPWLPRHHFILSLTGGVGILLIACTRIVMAGQITTPEIRMINLPQGREAGWISYIIDEQDCVIFGEALFHKLGGVFPNEHENITSKLFTAYSELRTRQGIFPSPFMDTYLNLQRPAAFDAILIEPENNRHPRVAVVFLHGFMGNVTAQCWEIARAVDRFGALTVCPSAGWQGEWRKPQGEAILRATFSYLREQGFQQFYLGGFSNGGFGISSLASRLGNEEGLLGLFFIDGISDGAGIISLGLPVLILQGAEDERMPAPAARRTAEIIGNLGTYVELDSDHFVIMKRPHLVQSALAEWLKIHAADK